MISMQQRDLLRSWRPGVPVHMNLRRFRMQKLYVGDNEELSFEVEMRPEDVVLLHIYRE